VIARLATEHPERVAGLLLIDGGLTLPMPADVDPQAVANAVLGPAIARLQMTFPTREAYREWWSRHPAIAAGDVDEDVLAAYSDHDLIGEEPELRSSVSEPAVRGDAAEWFEWGEPAHRLTVPAKMLCAPRGLLNDPNPTQPKALGEAWAAEAAGQREVSAVPDVNHYTIVFGRRGAAVVADAIAAAVDLVRVPTA
jgi:pimeloyl-ACP methyl ester carboxylesterase